MNEHVDTLNKLNSDSPINKKLQFVHATIQERYPSITRIAVALFDDKSRTLSTFIYSSDRPSPLYHYQARIDEVPSLKKLMENGATRVIDDMPRALASEKPSEHTRALLEGGFQSSYTFPMFTNGVFLGFIFFNATRPGFFEPAVLAELDMSAHLIALLIYNEHATVRTLIATVRSALLMTHSRDPETGSHLERMARYSRMIAQALAERHNLSDEYIEHIYLFAPIHDVGKLKVPDRILKKAGKLDPREMQQMRQHARYGRELIEALLENYQLEGVGYVSMLKNIPLYHHEKLNGEGYPEGLAGEAIPLEARIIAVADIFDALTSRRPYKDAWSNEEAIAELRRLAGVQLDEECVEALVGQRREIEEVQHLFKENDFG
ncbi:HD domain-containing protein [Marinobacteraceae bacterium S3BR75-40.1]